MAKSDLHENPFRDEIFGYLLDHGYVECNKDDFDVKNALDITHLFAFLEDTQNEELEKFKAEYGNKYKEVFIKLLNRKIGEIGLLQTIKSGVIEDYRSNSQFRLAYFKTSIQAMREGLDKYSKNIFSVIRELAYENKPHSNRIDLAVFINGLPIVLVELKKQTAGQKAGFEGTRQFIEDRNAKELIFAFNKRTLAYFAMDEFVAFIATKLDSKNTRFLPFNAGDKDGAGNPPVEGKHSTYYVWEKILNKDMLLRIIREFMFIDDEGSMIFPRFHQLRAVLKCEDDVLKNGVGGRYLIWHSAGSGKTKTIAWLAKRLINISEINTVIVISDRNVIDGQLGMELMTLDGKKGVAQHIDDGSQGLLSRLEKGGYIVITTLQKFRPIIGEIKQHHDRKYAIIIDEAHSSTAGKSLSKASETLAGKSLKEAAELDDIYEELEDAQNQILTNAKAIMSTSNVSYFAFTATPRKETIELFGNRNEQGKTYFDKYSMKQAIEERFIVNPLLCYTSYSDYYQVAKKKDDDKLYDSARAQAAILNYISSDNEVINTKVAIMLQDFVKSRYGWLAGKAKAMVITPSRKHAVLYKLAVDKYIKEHGYGFRSCVAFTGTVEIDEVKYTERSMNSEWVENNGKYDIKSIISNHNDLRFIIVADKLQTGFDEKQLCIMYIDKKLGSSVKAVQTISRLNRPANGKRTFVLDFVNDKEAIKKYFSEFYGGELYLPETEEMNISVLGEKIDKILGYYIVTQEDVDRLFKFSQDMETNSGRVTYIIAKISEKFIGKEKNVQKEFLSELKKFSSLYYYLAAVFNAWDAKYEKFATVFAVVYKVLYEPEEIAKIDPEELVELVSYSTKLVVKDMTIELETSDKKYSKTTNDVSMSEKKYSDLDQIIASINKKYEKASEELNEIVDSLSKDVALQDNVRKSAKSAYEEKVNEKVSDKLTEKIIEAVLNENDIDKANFYTALSNDPVMTFKICSLVIQNIKMLLTNSYGI